MPEPAASGKPGKPGQPADTSGTGGAGGQGGEGGAGRTEGGPGGPGGGGGAGASRRARTAFTAPVVIAYCVLALGMLVGIYVNREAISNLEKLRHEREVVTCRNAAQDRTVEREILQLRIDATPNDPVVPRYQQLLDTLPPLDCTNPATNG